ncbi:nucleotide-sugar uncharacterized transporter 1 isoform X2 [Malus domestica]|uniref:nucleotide-sugar uncharacterized transporter 1 isoform X2 n=1 Tax=Malus domestica TaxID=3750 RepID=UPI0007ECE90D|nr:nucleotide-sugar uncharacterized transporter 1 isoform X4 [Malus domestica]
MLNFFLRKGVRKILKRKDSDAGERGRALEDLRSVLFNEFRSSDGARRQQQQLCGPATALTFNFVIAVGIIFVNKLVLKVVGFQFPIFLTFIHYVVSWLLMALLNALCILSACPSKSTRSSTLFTLGFVMAFSTGLANVSLKYNRIFVVQQESFFLEALAWIIPSAVNKILWSSLQQQENWTALALMWKTTPITLFFLVALIPWLDPPGALSFNWNFNNTLAILMSAILGFLLQWSGALALGATSAVTHVVLGQFKTCVILLGNYYLFSSNPGKTSISGAFTAIAGMSIYTYLNLKLQSNKTFPRQASSLPKSKENSYTHVGNYGSESV